MIISNITYLLHKDVSIDDDDFIIKYKNKIISYSYKNKEDIDMIFTLLFIIDKYKKDSAFIGFNSVKNKFFIKFPINNESFKNEILLELLNINYNNSVILLRKIRKLKKKIYSTNNIELFKMKDNKYIIGSRIIKLKYNTYPKISDINKDEYISKIYSPLFKSILEDIV